MSAPDLLVEGRGTPGFGAEFVVGDVDDDGWQELAVSEPVSSGEAQPAPHLRL